MNALTTALRSIDRTNFEALVVALLKARYPNTAIDIKHVDGEAGDEGLDIILGQLDERPTVWQCKAFRGPVRDSQKTQIRNSLNRVLQHYTPRRWVLCMTTDFDAKGHRWWQRLRESNSERTEMDLSQASDIVQQLIYQHTVRETFFPGVTINAPMIREALARTESLSDSELFQINENNMDAYLARLERLDGRFSYSVTYVRNVQPISNVPTGTILTITRGSSAIHVSARDQEALRAAPPEVNLTVVGSGVEKFLANQRTGCAVKLSAAEIGNFSSDLEFLFPEGKRPVSIEISPIAHSQTIPLRVTFGKGVEAITYPYIEFRLAQSGTEESTLRSLTPLPFEITLVLGAGLGVGRVSFRYRCSGHPLRDALRMSTAVLGAVRDAEVSFYDIRRDQPFVSAHLDGGEVPASLIALDQFFREVSEVERDYQIDLVVPERFSEQDLIATSFLRRLQAGFASRDAISLAMVRSEHAAREVDIHELAKPDSSFLLVLPEFPERMQLFETTVLTGPVRYEILHGRIQEAEAYRDFLLNAEAGTTMILTIVPVECMTVRRCTSPM